MPPRPSRNLDRALLAAGRELLPARGCAGLSIREVAQAAGVNLGMFHYHFKSREAFLRAVLQSLYEEMYSQLSFEGAREPGARENLRAALRFMGRFLRQNRALLTRVMADALSGDPVALEFLRGNMPRHLGLLYALVVEGQKRGDFIPMDPAQALGFCAGSLAMPVIFAGAVLSGGALPAPMGRHLEKALLADAALDQRIDLALAAISTPKPAAKAGRKRK